MAKRRKLRNLEYYDLQSCFDKLYFQAKQGYVFKDLIKIISSEANIRLAYRNIKHNKGRFTAGVDNLNIQDLAKMPIEHFIDLVRNEFNWYMPQAVMRKEIVKANGGIRPLGIPTITDRLVQQCILQVLEPICEAKFHDCNYGYRPNRSMEQAIAQCYDMINDKQLLFVVDIDIKGFFDNVNHSKLIRQMWALGIRDKKLLCIIKKMLKAPIVIQDGGAIIPKKGIPQGGILSPLLANIVLNELDWWISNKWENNFSDKLTEMYIVRYVDDFKIFCRCRSAAEKIFSEVTTWLKKRLKLTINTKKSKIVDLKKNYSDFLGFKMHAFNKGGDTYEVISHMSDRALQSASDKLMKQLWFIKRSNGQAERSANIDRFNDIVIGIHNYYKFATEINSDCMRLQTLVSSRLNKLIKGVKTKGCNTNVFIYNRYGQSDLLRFVGNMPICPIGYVVHKKPIIKSDKINQYTPDGRNDIYRKLQLNESVIQNLHKISKKIIPGQSIEFHDNLLPLYVSQFGKCMVTGQFIDSDDLTCHRIKPNKDGNKDTYDNLLIVSKEVHMLIHADDTVMINTLINIISPDVRQLKIINILRQEIGYPIIAIS